jgi:cob(I)alamin adenosyltransferase
MTDEGATDGAASDASGGTSGDTGSDPDPDEAPEPPRPTPGGGVAPEPAPIEPAAPAEFGLVQVWWGDGKGKTTAALGMALRAAGHGYRVHVLQFMKGGADSVESVRGEYNALAALPGASLERTGHYGWHGMADGTDADDHAAEARAGVRRARELLAAADRADLDAPLPLEGSPDEGVHMLVLDELLYAVSMGLIEEAAVLDLLDRAPAGLELVVTGSHEEPTYLDGRADLVSEVCKRRHPIDDGQRARKGTEY